MEEGFDERDGIVRSIAALALALVAALIVLWVVAGLLGFGVAIGLIFAGVTFLILPYLLPRHWPPVDGATVDRSLALVKGLSSKADKSSAPAPVETAPVAPPAPVAAPIAPPAVAPAPVAEAAPVTAPEPASVPEPVVPTPEASAPAEPVATPNTFVPAAFVPADGAAADGEPLAGGPAANAISERVRTAAKAAGEAARLLAGDMAAPVANAKPTGLNTPRDGNADDLKRIKGVGPKLEALLHDLGVYHFDQIAAWGPAEVAWVDAHLEGFSGRATRDDWIGQARLLAGGGETDHSKRVDAGLST